MLNLQSSDFGASSRQDTKYAQSWALFRFLFESEDQALRGISGGGVRAARGHGSRSGREQTS